MFYRYKVEQGSLEWLTLRAGRPTSSKFSEIITPVKAEFSKGRFAYQNELVGELILGKSDENSFISRDMELGKILEAEAVKQYEFIHEVETEKAGFFLDGTKRSGASPDRLVGDDGLLEVKCQFTIKDQMSYLYAEEIGRDHWPQIQGQLMITERKWCEWWCFHAELPPARFRVVRDEPFIAKLREYLDKFLDELNAKVEIAIQNGWIVIEEPKNILAGG